MTVIVALVFRTGEETKNPKRTIPLAIMLSLFLVTLAYSGMASVLTLMWPYYDQVRIKKIHAVLVSTLNIYCWVFFFLVFLSVLCFSIGSKRAVAGHLPESGSARNQIHGHERSDIRSIHHVSHY